MKLNKLNKIYVGVIALLLMATAIRLIWYKSWERFYYGASVFTPKYYPIYLQEAEFLPQNDGAYLSFEDVNDFYSDWGQESSPYQNFDEAHLLPEKLLIRYVSYQEKAVYADTIALPKEKMMEIFKKAKNEHKTISTHSYYGEREALTFLIGIANNGNMLISLRGKDFDTVILKKHLNKQSPNSKIVYLDYATRERKEKLLKDCFNELFEGMGKDLKTKIDSGYEKNANYIDSATISRNFNN